MSKKEEERTEEGSPGEVREYEKAEVTFGVVRDYRVKNGVGAKESRSLLFYLSLSLFSPFSLSRLSMELDVFGGVWKYSF